MYGILHVIAFEYNFPVLNALDLAGAATAALLKRRNGITAKIVIPVYSL
jgi:hypothetical protein